MTYPPPLAEVTGTVQPAEVFGGFGPVDAFTWRGACVGGCGARPGCRQESPRPECSGCGRRRTGARGGDGAIGRIVPVPARVLPGELDVPHRVLITASRTWDDAATLRAALDERRQRYGARLVVVHGHCPDGGDAIADAWYLEHYGWPPERHPADWPTHGRAAGPIRNSAMVATRPDECLAFLRSDSRGTADCAGKAERAGIPTTRYHYGQPLASEPVNQPVTILRPAREVSPCDASLPAAVRTLVRLADEHGRAVRVTAAAAARNGLLVASIAVRVHGVGWAVYEREGETWGFAGGALVVPHLHRCNVGQFRAALSGEQYVPPAPREPIRGCCVKCRAEVSITATGAIYANHRCGTTKAVEGRS